VTEWHGVVEVAYGTVMLADAEAAARGLSDPEGVSRLMEVRCGSLELGIQVMVPERDDPVATHVRVLGGPAAIEPEWEHVAEVGFRAPTGRLLVFSWLPDEDLAGEIAVPTEPLVARIHWAGLEAWLQDRERAYVETGEPGPVHLRIDLVPGELTGVRTIRTWHLWEPPTPESISPAGLRRYRGSAADERRRRLQPNVIRFWSPYPSTEEGDVTSLWQDPEDASQWASGSGPMGHPFLQELSDDEARSLEDQGFPPVRTYARDADGRIWSADQIPLERAPALVYMPAAQWQLIQGIFPADQIRLVELPTGWSRITSRAKDGRRSPILVKDIEGEGDPGLYYQRWPDGAELPR
jgi:hypothetical protein